MNKTTVGLLFLGGIILAIALIIVLWIMGAYNGFIKSEETVNEKWANVQSAYQRRADLIPNLVATVKQYATFEQSTLTAITEARAKVGSATTPTQLQAAGDEMNSAIARLLVVAEAYPDLKANENFLSLQDELAGTENRIKVERDNYNTAVKNYNVKVRQFPNNIIAGMFGFNTKDMFLAQAGTENVPDVASLFE